MKTSRSQMAECVIETEKEREREMEGKKEQMIKL